MELIKEYLMSAESAYSNKQYEESLSWYKKVLEKTPNDLYVLSRAGAICVPLGKFQEALEFFGKAVELDANNGDNYFNYANACFFNKDYVKAFETYVEAERKGCSEDVLPRLYYQMALLCSIRQDIKSSLIYFQKCEEADADGLLSLNPDLISEKIKLFMVVQDYKNAEKCAAQLVAIQPTEFKNYMIYFSILMAHKDFDTAEKVLKNAEKYAENNSDSSFNIVLQLASLYISKGEATHDTKSICFDTAIRLLKDSVDNENFSEEQKQQIIIALSEAYLKNMQFEKVIDTLAILFKKKEELIKSDDNTDLPIDLIVDSMLREDLENMELKILSGEIDESIGEFASTDFDEFGNEIRVYHTDITDANNKTVDNNTEETPNKAKENRNELEIYVKEKVYFTLLSAFLGKEDFANAKRVADILKHSENKYYSYYGIYTSALSLRKLSNNIDTIDRKYTETIAYFRNKTISDPSDNLASIFRARLYVESGKIEKAKEIALLLSEVDKQSIFDYINQSK